MDIDNFRNLTKRAETILNSQLFFVCGAEKSGTTWLQRMLDTHPEVMCSGEGHFIDVLSIQLAEVVNNYNAVRDRVVEDVYEGKGYYDHITQAEFDAIILLAMASTNKRYISKEIKCIGDKTPINALYLNSIHRLFPQAKVIQIVRDGRDVVVSVVKHLQRTGRGKDQGWSIEAKTERVSRSWHRTTVAGYEFGQQHPELYHMVKYEEVKQNPVKEMKKIFKFLGVTADDEAVEHCCESNSFEKLSGGRKPGEEDANSFIRKGIVGDWKNHLGEKELATFEEIAGDLMKKLGY